MYRFIFLIGLFISTAAFACDKKASLRVLQDYIWLTEDYPPYNFFDEQGNVTGISVDILTQIYQELGLELRVEEIRLIPWARLVRDVKRSQKFAAFTMVYTPSRAKNYTLVPMSLPTTISVMVLDEALDQHRASSINELTIAVVREDIGQVKLNSNGISAKQIMTTSHQSMVNMLYRHRVDAIAFNEELVKYHYNRKTTGEHAIKTLHVLQEDLDNNFVFHKKAPSCVIELFNSAVEKLANDGTMAEISKRYLPEN